MGQDCLQRRGMVLLGGDQPWDSAPSLHGYMNLFPDEVIL
jgi:hypothetical protein